MSKFKISLTGEDRLVIAIILLLNLWHFFTLDYYDFSKDEYYKMALAKRPAWGYLGTMPFSVWLVGLTNLVFGETLIAIRAIPALLSILTSFMLVHIVRILGGTFGAKLLAVAAFLASPLVMGTFHLYSQNSIDVFFWSLSLFLLIVFIKHGDKRVWYLLMVSLGIALSNRLTILWLGFTIFLYFLFFHRGWITSRHFWVGGLIPLALFMPILTWQYNHDFAHFNYVAGSSSGYISVWEFWLNQVLIHNPLTMTVWFTGLIFLVQALIRTEKSFRLLSVIALGSFIIVTLFGREKSYNFYYALPVFTILFPVGAIALTRILQPYKRAVIVCLILLTLSSVLTSIFFFTPFANRSYGFIASSPSLNELVQQFDLQTEVPPQISNQYDWRELNHTFRAVMETIAESDKHDLVIWPNHYSFASAIEILNPDLDLPVISHSESYWIYGYPKDKSTYLVICNSESNMLELFESVELIESHLCPECPSWRRVINFFLAKSPTGLEEYWSSNLKN